MLFPSNRYGYEASFTFELYMGYNYLHRVYSSKFIGDIHVGGLLDWSINIQNYENWDDSHIYWLNVYEMGPVVRWSKDVWPNHKFAAFFNFPVMAIASRPPKYRYYDQERLPEEIFSKPHENMKFTSLHEYVSFCIRGDYTYRLSRLFSLGVSYLMNFRTHSSPERISIFGNTILFRVIFTPGAQKKEEI